MEIWDVYLRDGSLANKDLIWGEQILNGLYLIKQIIVDILK